MQGFIRKLGQVILNVELANRYVELDSLYLIVALIKSETPDLSIPKGQHNSSELLDSHRMRRANITISGVMAVSTVIDLGLTTIYLTLLSQG